MLTKQTIRRGAVAIGMAAALATQLTVGTLVASATTKPADHHKANPISITVLEPAAGEVVTGSEMAVKVKTSGFKLDARYAGTPANPKVGHFHMIIDGHLIDMSPSVRNATSDTISMVGLQPGAHVLTVVPAGNDHAEWSQAAQNVPFTYAGPYIPEPAGYSGPDAASISLIGPANGSFVSGGSVTLTADIKNFVLCGECYGKPNVMGEGHWHIFVDLPMSAVDPMSMMPYMKTMASDPSQLVSLKGLRAGRHTFTAILVGNDHIPTMPMAMSAITVTIRSGHHRR